MLDTSKRISEYAVVLPMGNGLQAKEQAFLFPSILMRPLARSTKGLLGEESVSKPSSEGACTVSIAVLLSLEHMTSVVVS